MEPTEDGTRVTNTIEVGSDHVITTVIFVVFGPLVRMMTRKQLSKELEILKTALETQS